MPPRRRTRQQAGRSGPEPFGPPLSTRWTLIITAVCVVVVLAAGVTIQLTTAARPTGAFAACRTQPELAPGFFAGAPKMCINPTQDLDATIATTGGDVTVLLQTSRAPQTVNNFVVLALNGYYDGRAFQSSSGWYIASGDTRDFGYTLARAPIPRNEKWSPGSLGMARLPDGRISGSQFFITRSAWQGGNPPVSYNQFGIVLKNFSAVTALSDSNRILRITVSKG
ncbi:MAG: peptidylprolyl isomerase [Candidatus Dormibacteraeota bacterium]|nr:peptidylprolyl isomerase [Candidatus Dormibacteraeota bacterium]